LLSFRLVGRTIFASTMPTNTDPAPNSFVGKIHLTQDKLMSVEMWYVDATPWCSAIRRADLFVSLAEGVSTAKCLLLSAPVRIFHR
jgi:hypothetical protein